MYGEDNDYFYRCAKAGFKTIQTNIPVWHKGEGFSGYAKMQLIVTRYVYRNWLRFSIKNYAFWGIVLVIAKMVIYALLPNRLFRRKLYNRSVNRLIRFKLSYRVRSLLGAFFWNIANLKNTKKAKKSEVNIVHIRPCGDEQKELYKKCGLAKTTTK